jgi:2-polyprenylphenol 6-hydroxylase
VSLGFARDFDAVIVGAGVTGAAMAALLGARGICAPGRIALIADRFAVPAAAAADWDLRVYALSRASERLLKICGAWAHVPAQRLCAYERMQVWDAAGSVHGAGSLRFDSAALGEPNLGFIVDGHAVQVACLAAARAAGTVLIEGEAAALEAHASGREVRLRDGRRVAGALLIGADGVESTLRSLLGIATAGHAYHQDALVAHVQTSITPAATAWQRFLPGGPLAFLPLGDGRCSIVWSLPRAEAARLRALPVTEFDAALTQASDGVLGTCTTVLGPVAFPLQLKYALDYARPHAVLLGDAAHVVHPLAGQGLNLGLLDCAVLAEVLEQAGGAAHLGDARLLRRYERRRRSENLLAGAALDGLERLFAARDPLSKGLRKAGLGMVGRAPFLLRGLARHALGLSGDVPQFLRGDPASPRR